MEVGKFFQVFLTNYHIVFACILCYLPFTGALKMSLRRIAVISFGVLTAYLLAVTAIILLTGVSANMLLFPVLPVFFIFYRRTLDTSFYKALDVFLTVISLFCYPALYTFIFCARLHLGSVYTDYTWGSALFSFLLSFLFLCIFWHPARIHLCWLVENFHVSSVWKREAAWPLLFVLATNFIVPRNYSVLDNDRFFYIYLCIVTLLLFCMCYLYFLLYGSARGVYERNRLERQNQFLGFQSEQYQMLTRHMEETRRIRHDFRQQLLVICGLADTGDYEALREYLSEYRGSIAEEYAPLCANPAVNAIASYYMEQCTTKHIAVSWALNLPARLPVSEPEYCVMLGNLLENAMEACDGLPESKRKIEVISHMPTDSMLVLIVENYYGHEIRKEKGRFVSSRHSWEAVGLVSVEETVKRYHGDMRIEYDEERFCVNILMNL